MIEFLEVIEDPHVLAKERDAQVLAMRRRGMTLEAIAKELGITRERVRGLEARAYRREHEAVSNEPKYELSVRARNCVSNAIPIGEETTPENVAKLSYSELMAVPNVEITTAIEINKWVVKHGFRLRGDW